MKQSILSEEVLVDLLFKRERQAITYLYDHYKAALYGVLYRIVPDEDEALDLLQDTFVKIWKNFDQYDPTKGRLYTWMVNVARNLAIDKLRSKDFNNNSKNQPIDNVVNVLDSSKNYSINPDTIGLKEMMAKLSPEQISIIDLLYYQGYTQVEVAEELNIPLGTVKTRARLAISILRKEFDKEKV